MTIHFSNKKFINTLCLVASIFVSVHALGAQQAADFTKGMRYSPAGQLTGTLAPDPDGSGSLHYFATRNSYSEGLLTKVETGELKDWQTEDVDPSAWESNTTFTIYSTQVITYDSYGRKASVTIKAQDLSALSVTEYSYDSKGRSLCVATRMSLTITGDACTPTGVGTANADRVTRFTYDNYDHITTEERAVGTTKQQNYVTNVYDRTLLRYQVDANCNKTELRYDTNARLASMVYPSPNAPLTAGQTCDKPSTVNSLPSKSGSVNESDYVAFQYDNNGNKNYERKRNNTIITYIVDGNNRVIFKDYSNPDQLDISYNYDLRGLQLSAKFASNNKGITNTFDGFGNLSSSTNDMTDTFKIGYLYDLNNNRTRIEHPDGAKFTYKFDGLNRIAALVDGSVNTMLGITYQANGKRNNISRYNGATTLYNYDNGVQLKSFSQTFSAAPTNNLTNSFTYNAASQINTLTQSNPLYSYQGNDNRTGNYVPDGLNRYKSAGAQAMGYDANSNLKYDGTTYYNYDDENRLLSMTKLDDTNYNPQITYDPNGRLYQITFKGKTTKYVYDGDALILEWSSETNVISRRYVHGDQVDEPLVQFNGPSVATADRIYLHADQQGSIIAQTNSAGAVVGTLAYDAYGIPAATNNVGFGYTGQLWLKDLGLDYYKARMYSPVLGRFLQTDPIGYKDDYDLYSYVGNDPVNRTDPTGTTCTQNDKGVADCKVDDPGKLSKTEVAQVNAAYTKGVNNLLKHPDRTSTITVNGKSFTVTAGAQAKALMGATVRGGTVDHARAATANGTLNPSKTESGGPEVTINRNAISKSAMENNREDDKLSRTFIHESIHMAPEEKVMQPFWDADSHKYNQDHHDAYNNSAAELFKQ